MKNRWIHIRVTEEEYQAIQAEAEKGRRSFSDFLRLCVSQGHIWKEHEKGAGDGLFRIGKRSIARSDQ